jgi:hypothetical protein
MEAALEKLLFRAAFVGTKSDYSALLRQLLSGVIRQQENLIIEAGNEY